MPWATIQSHWRGEHLVTQLRHPTRLCRGSAMEYNGETLMQRTPAYAVIKHILAVCKLISRWEDIMITDYSLVIIQLRQQISWLEYGSVANGQFLAL